jgi:predicted enzyme related to lactoylglutathione lyase
LIDAPGPLDESRNRRRRTVIEGVSQVIVDVDDQDRALRFWTETMEFELAQDAPYGDGGRWIEVRTRDNATALVLRLRQGDRPTAPEERPTSDVFFYCDDLRRTYDELRARGVEFPQPPVQQSWGWWSMFRDREGNRFALHPSDERRIGDLAR